MYYMHFINNTAMFVLSNIYVQLKLHSLTIIYRSSIEISVFETNELVYNEIKKQLNSDKRNFSKVYGGFEA